MKPHLRKLTLLGHIIFSVGWLGSVAGFLSLSVAGLTCRNDQMVRSFYLAMEPITWFVIVPFAIASLLTGVLLSLGTKWGLFRHYWVLIKFLINLLSIVILLLHTRIIDYMAKAAARSDLSKADLDGPGTKLTVAAIAALVALLFATVLSVYKPRGITAYGWRIQNNRI